MIHVISNRFDIGRYSAVSIFNINNHTFFINNLTQNYTLFENRIMFTLSSFNLLRLADISSPALLNSRSDGTDIAVRDKYTLATFCIKHASTTEEGLLFY